MATGILLASGPLPADCFSSPLHVWSMDRFVPSSRQPPQWSRNFDWRTDQRSKNSLEASPELRVTPRKNRGSEVYGQGVTLRAEDLLEESENRLHPLGKSKVHPVAYRVPGNRRSTVTGGSVELPTARPAVRRRSEGAPRPRTSSSSSGQADESSPLTSSTPTSSCRDSSSSSSSFSDSGSNCEYCRLSESSDTLECATATATSSDCDDERSTSSSSAHRRHRHHTPQNATTTLPTQGECVRPRRFRRNSPGDYLRHERDRLDRMRKKTLPPDPSVLEAGPPEDRVSNRRTRKRNAAAPEEKVAVRDRRYQILPEHPFRNGIGVRNSRNSGDGSDERSESDDKTCLGNLRTIRKHNQAFEGQDRLVETLKVDAKTTGSWDQTTERSEQMVQREHRMVARHQEAGERNDQVLKRSDQRMVRNEDSPKRHSRVVEKRDQANLRRPDHSTFEMQVQESGQNLESFDRNEQMFDKNRLAIDSLKDNRLSGKLDETLQKHGQNHEKDDRTIETNDPTFGNGAQAPENHDPVFQRTSQTIEVNGRKLHIVIGNHEESLQKNKSISHSSMDEGSGGRSELAVPISKRVVVGDDFADEATEEDIRTTDVDLLSLTPRSSDVREEVLSELDEFYDSVPAEQTKSKWREGTRSLDGELTDGRTLADPRKCHSEPETEAASPSRGVREEDLVSAEEKKAEKNVQIATSEDVSTRSSKLGSVPASKEGSASTSRCTTCTKSPTTTHTEEEEEEGHGGECPMCVEERRSVTSSRPSSTRGPDFLRADFNIEPEIVRKANPLVDEAEVELVPSAVGAFRRLSEDEFVAILSIHEAARKGDLHVVKLLTKRDPKQMETVDERGWTPIHLAAAYGHAEVVRYLATEGAHLSALDPSSYTAVHLAAMNGHNNCLEVLLPMGVDVDSVTAEGFTALHLAVMNVQLECCQTLLQWGGSLEKKDALGRCVHDMVDEYDLKEVARLLARFHRQVHTFRNMLNLINSRSGNGESKSPDPDIPREFLEILASIAEESGTE